METRLLLRFLGIYGFALLVTLTVAMFIAPWRMALLLVFLVAAITFPVAIRRFQEDARRPSGCD